MSPVGHASPPPALCACRQTRPERQALAVIDRRLYCGLRRQILSRRGRPMRSSGLCRESWGDPRPAQRGDHLLTLAYRGRPSSADRQQRNTAQRACVPRTPPHDHALPTFLLIGQPSFCVQALIGAELPGRGTRLIGLARRQSGLSLLILMTVMRCRSAYCCWVSPLRKIAAHAGLVINRSVFTLSELNTQLIANVVSCPFNKPYECIHGCKAKPVETREVANAKHSVIRAT